MCGNNYPFPLGVYEQARCKRQAGSGRIREALKPFTHSDEWHSEAGLWNQQRFVCPLHSMGWDWWNRHVPAHPSSKQGRGHERLLQGLQGSSAWQEKVFLCNVWVDLVFSAAICLRASLILSYLIWESWGLRRRRLAMFGMRQVQPSRRSRTSTSCWSAAVLQLEVKRLCSRFAWAPMQRASCPTWFGAQSTAFVTYHLRRPSRPCFFVVLLVWMLHHCSFSLFFIFFPWFHQPFVQDFDVMLKRNPATSVQIHHFGYWFLTVHSWSRRLHWNITCIEHSSQTYMSIDAWATKVIPPTFYKQSDRWASRLSLCHLEVCPEPPLMKPNLSWETSK